MKRIKRVRIGTEDLDVPQLVSHARTVKTKLEEGTTFDGLDAQITMLHNATELLHTRHQNVVATGQTLEQQQALEGQQRTEVENILSVLGAGVEHTAQGDTAVILASGFDLQASPQPVGPVGAPQNLRAQTSDTQGEVTCRWRRLLGAASYFVECSEDPTGPWLPSGVTTRASFQVTGLVSGKRYRFRVRALGTAGLGPWSDEAVKMAA